MEKDFFEVFPNLKVKQELEELLDMVLVTKVSCNPARRISGFISEVRGGFTRSIFLSWKIRLRGSFLRDLELRLR